MKKPTGDKRDCARVKLAAAADPTLACGTSAALPGVLRATFPDETDQGAASLWLGEVEPTHVESTLRTLHALPGVEYAEEAAPRKSIRGVVADRG
ncbi:MAG: hypothetical protein NZ578_06135 [Candidatus Binatia bacterium]|nr:hypothetical protein [Candidatus Binatia bacterium]